MDKLYHIAHIDRLASIYRDQWLYCDALMSKRKGSNGLIGMQHIKTRRLHLPLASHPGLHVGQCVPFYFAPRSVMLYIISRANHRDVAYTGGQDSIVHLEFGLQQMVCWAVSQRKRWAFTDRNAGSSYFSDFDNLDKFNRINWRAVRARDWRSCIEEKQAEFLVEHSVPWRLVERVGVIDNKKINQLNQILTSDLDRAKLEVMPSWYY
ncbi:MAG: type II toxin-antitoxin system toxin DNA ADP-ribosyl transferase DarT [Gammaproteobacteria bacterium]